MSLCWDAICVHKKKKEKNPSLHFALFAFLLCNFRCSQKIYFFQANPLTGLISAFSTIFRLRTFPHLFMPIISVKSNWFLKHPCFYVSLVDSKGGKGNEWNPKPDLNDQQSCKSKLCTRHSKILYFQISRGLQGRQQPAHSREHTKLTIYNKRDGDWGGCAVHIRLKWN